MSEPAVCGVELWCGLDAGHLLVEDRAGSGHEVVAEGDYDLPGDVYHSHAAWMSSSGARGDYGILPPSCPARAKWRADNPEFKDAYDLGTVTHADLLGKGPEVVEVEHDTWRTRKAQDARDEARDRGAVPLLTKDLARVRDMVTAVRQHRIAGPLLDDEHAVTEHSIFWTDPFSGVRCRAMLDSLRITGPLRPLVVDVKTISKLDRDSIERSVTEHGYHQQAPWYVDGVESLGLEWWEVGFLFVFVAKDPPHLVRVVQLDDEAIARGRDRNHRARQEWAACVDSGEWPGFADDDIDTIGLTRWAPL